MKPIKRMIYLQNITYLYLKKKKKFNQTLSNEISRKIHLLIYLDQISNEKKKKKGNIWLIFVTLL